MYIHNLNPVFLDFGLIEIRWYSLAYIIGILLGWWLGKKIILNILKSILTVQLLATCALIYYSATSVKFAEFTIENSWLYYFCLIFSIIIEFAIFCCKGPARKVPINYICLALFTVTFAYMIACIVCRITMRIDDEGELYINEKA